LENNTKFKYGILKNNKELNQVFTQFPQIKEKPVPIIGKHPIITCSHKRNLLNIYQNKMLTNYSLNFTKYDYMKRNESYKTNKNSILNMNCKNREDFLKSTIDFYHNKSKNSLTEKLIHLGNIQLIKNKNYKEIISQQQENKRANIFKSNENLLKLNFENPKNAKHTSNSKDNLNKKIIQCRSSLTFYDVKLEEF